MHLQSVAAGVLAAILLMAANPSATGAPTPTRPELNDARQWTAAHFAAGGKSLPFTFRYGGTPSSELLPRWNPKATRRHLADAREETTLQWTAPDSSLSVRCVVVTDPAFSAVEWTVWFSNPGPGPSRELTDVNALDGGFQAEGPGEFVLHGTVGDWCTAASFEPFSRTLEPGSTNRFAPVGGRPTNAAFPYYNLQYPGGGTLLAIGWPGQWSASFERDGRRGLQVRAGQERFRAVLRPGESIRTPLIALVRWRGEDRVRAQNLWRRWMVARNLPRTGDGQLPPTQIVACSSHQFREMTQATESNQVLFVDRYLQEGLRLDYWWMDAGWYPCGGEWPRTGTWEPDRARFPHGLRAISDHARARGVRTIVWFEPERVGDPESWLARNHPEWLLSRKARTPSAPRGGLFGSGPGSLLNLGDPAARSWLIAHVDRLIREEGIDLYRQDFNMDPLPFWHAADAPDREGMTENLYVQGYLAYWDALRERHPGLRIDSCASGGRRDDLETLRRAVPLIRSDFLFEPTSQQNHHYQFASWIPYHGAGYVTGTSSIGGTGTSDVESYGFRANMSPSLTLCYDMRATNSNYALARRLFNELKQIQPDYLGDFYPLTPYSQANDVWMAWQYDRPEAGTGVVQGFRRPESPEPVRTLHLQGLTARARYEIHDFDGKAWVQTGRELMEQGLTATLVERRSAVVFTYRKLD